MKRNIAILAVITSVVILGGSFAFGNLLSDYDRDQLKTTSSPVGLTGHVTLVVYDSEGNIKKYMQGDNNITNNGENCIAELVFGVATGGASNCLTVGSSPGFTVVVIGEGATTPDGASLTVDGAFKTTTVSSPGITSSTGLDDTTSKAIVTLLATFTATSGQTFTNAGVFDTTGTTNNMLAHKAFTTGATLTSGDTVAVTWTIDIGP